MTLYSQTVHVKFKVDMDFQTNIQIVTKNTTIASRIIEKTVEKSLKRALTQQFLDKIVHETINCLKHSSISKLKNRKQIKTLNQQTIQF